LCKLVNYGLIEGQKIADSMGYIPLPASVIAKVKAALAKIQLSDSPVAALDQERRQCRDWQT
jgi:hypothetical protein